jgi:protein-S-isoprenylcysteine O-methyltransferase Ste14
MRRTLATAYALTVYAAFLAVFGYLVLFTEGLLVPKTLDTDTLVPLPVALAIDLGLIALFGLQHSVMARQGFKRQWARLVPAPLERTTYVLVTSVLFALFIWLWIPLPARVWQIDASAARTALWALSFGGWGLALFATFLYDHFELFGLRQVYDHVLGRPQRPTQFKTPSLYQHVRHPMYLGMLTAFWAAPTMSVGHLLFATGMTAYVLIALIFEERDLVRSFGDDYRRYRERVGALLPKLRRRA